MELRKNLTTGGAGFLGAGIAFLTIGLAADQSAFIAVAMPFITLGVVFLARSGKVGAP